MQGKERVLTWASGQGWGGIVWPDQHAIRAGFNGRDSAHTLLKNVTFPKEASSALRAPVCVLTRTMNKKLASCNS